MRKYIMLLITLLVPILALVGTHTYALSLWSLWDSSEVSRNSDTPKTLELTWNRSVFNIISFVNKYLWFTIGFVCFLFMIWNGYQLIMARWDEKEMKNATNALTWCAVWLTVCILAYIIVNLAVKLFA